MLLSDVRFEGKREERLALELFPGEPERRFGYIGTVKTAISIPDDLLERADATAKRLRISQSELFTRALTHFLERHEREAEVTRKLNEVYGAVPAKVDERFQQAQANLIKKSEW